ncbi:MAG: hypothetical protein REI09_03365 [Candidatus Dactylopiibacterium sp.]|nr:hypothetical protein [Candidatus Dactylopiibacterium sp.]
MNDTPHAVLTEAAGDSLVAFVAAPERAALADMQARLQREGWALREGGAAEALAWATGHPLPALLIVDLAAHAHPLQTLAELAATYGPTTQIVVLGDAQDVDLYRQLLQAGALEYLLKPLRLGLLASTLERAEHGTPLGQGAQARGGRTVAIAGATGGAGTSTVAAALGRLIAGQRQMPCVLVDFDRSKGDLPLLLAAEAEAGLAALLAAPEIDPRMLQRSLHSLPASLSAGVPQRLHLLAQAPAPHTPVSAARVLELGAALTQLFSLAIWDMPACQTEGVAEVLDHADVRVLLFDLNVQSARHVHRLVQRFGDERAGQRLLLVHNAIGAATPGQLTAARFEEFVGRRIDFSLPHAGGRLAESLLEGPLDVTRDTPFAQAVLALADTLLGRRAQPSGTAQPGWLQRLLRGPARV